MTIILFTSSKVCWLTWAYLLLIQILIEHLTHLWIVELVLRVHKLIKRHHHIIECIVVITEHHCLILNLMLVLHRIWLLHIRFRIVQVLFLNRPLNRHQLSTHYLFEVFLNYLFCSFEFIHVNPEQGSYLLHNFLNFIFALLNCSFIARNLDHPFISQSIIVLWNKNVSPR